MRSGQGEIYRRTFTAAERRALEGAAEAAPLDPEAELLRVLIMRELGRERSDDERVGRLVDRLVRLVRAQRAGARVDGRADRLDEVFDWLAEIGAHKRAAAALEGVPPAAVPEVGR